MSNNTYKYSIKILFTKKPILAPNFMNNKQNISSPFRKTMKLELNTDPLREWKLHSDWYSPTRLHDSPVKYDFPGDRFIPNRSLMDLDQAYTLLTSRTNYPAKCSFGAEYRRIIDGNLTLDSEGRPFRLLVFRGSPKSSRKSIRYIDELRRNDEEELNSINHPIIERKYSMREIRALDAPFINDDFYPNLMDWGKKNILAVILGQSVYLWNAENRRTNQLMSSATMYDLPISVSWSPNGKTLAVGHLECSYIQLWDADTCKLTRRLEVDDAIVGAASWNGHILTSGSNKTILNYDVRARNSLVSRVYAHTSRVCGLKWSMSGNLLASGGDDNDVYIWEASRMNSSQFVHRFTHHMSAVKALAWCPYNFDVLASGGGMRDRCIRLWNTQKGTCITSVETGSQICGLEWNKNYKEIASGHGLSPNVDRNDLSLWKYPSMVKVCDIKGHAARVLQLSQSPDGLILVSAGADETLRFWDIFGPAPPPKRQSILSLNAFPIR